jgi:hypothetical protein
MEQSDSLILGIFSASGGFVHACPPALRRFSSFSSFG